MHQWRAFVVYALTEEEAAALVDQAEQLDAPPLVPIHPTDEAKVSAAGFAVLRVDQVDPELSHVACIDCEMPYQVAHAYPCPGDPIDHDRKTGDPVYLVENSETGETRRVVWGRWVELCSV